VTSDKKSWRKVGDELVMIGGWDRCIRRAGFARYRRHRPNATGKLVAWVSWIFRMGLVGVSSMSKRRY
jgi:hypothetical protein